MLIQSDGDERALRILVIDDNKDSADSLTLLTQIWGYRARTAYDGLSGLCLFDIYQPDMVIADLAMPRLSGGALAEAIRLRPTGRHPILIAHSSDVGEARQRIAFDSGFDHFVAKPADPIALRSLFAGIAQYMWLLSAIRHENDVVGVNLTGT